LRSFALFPPRLPKPDVPPHTHIAARDTICHRHGEHAAIQAVGALRVSLHPLASQFMLVAHWELCSVYCGSDDVQHPSPSDGAPFPPVVYGEHGDFSSDAAQPPKRTAQAISVIPANTP